MNLRDKIEAIKSRADYSKDQLYLIEAINENSGFLLGDDRVFYIISHNETNNDAISTKYLSLKTNIYINTVENEPSFKPGYYDLLIYSGDINLVFFESFIELCSKFNYEQETLSFIDFFYSLLKLFELPKEVSYTNLVGLFGELVLIKFAYEKYNKEIFKFWHNSLGSTDKYDFSFPAFNIEVKTTVKEGMRFEIKHSQIFNEKDNFVAVINIDNDNSGMSVSEIFDYFKTTKPFSGSIDFMIKLQQEKQKVYENDFKEKKFSLSRILLFSNKTISTIHEIPNFIDSIHYMYDFASQEPVSFDSIFK